MEMGTKENENNWVELYDTSDFGNKYPTETMISIFHNIIKPNLNRKTNKILDFGCSIGANTKVFADLGFEVYGIDISQKAIDECVEINGFNKEHFICADVLKEGRSIKDLFQCEFDIILALNCLYYFSDSDLIKVMQQIEEVMGVESFFYGNMHTVNTYFLNHFNKYKNSEGMVAVKQSGRIDMEMYYNVVLDKRDMEKKFSIFKPQYVLKSSMELPEMVESIHFVGQKR